TCALMIMNAHFLARLLARTPTDEIFSHIAEYLSTRSFASRGRDRCSAGNEVAADGVQRSCIHAFPERSSRMNENEISATAKAVVRRNTEEVQGKGNFELFEELFADDFVDHTTQPGTNPDKAGVRKLYMYLREAFPDFHAEIHWQLADGDRVTTYKTYHGTHEGTFLGVAPTHRKIQFETVDVMRVQHGKITDHWGVGNLLSLMQQIGGWAPPPSAA